MNKKQIQKEILYSIAFQDHYVKKNNLFGFLKQQKKSKQKAVQTRNKKSQQKVNFFDKENFQKNENNRIKQQIQKQKKQILKQLTLAERLSLVPTNKKVLKESDWENIIQDKKVKKRITGNCAICLRFFKVEQQMLLSCGHCFHRLCFQTFEEKTNIKQCPICRTQNYQKIQINLGSYYALEKYSTQIQKVFRGYYQRKLFYNKLINVNYQAKCKLLKKRLLSYKMSQLNISMRKQMQIQVQDFNKKQKEQNVFELILKTQNLLQLYTRNIDKNKVQKFNDFKWQEIEQKIHQREECTICLQKFKKNDKIYLTSCTHVFHKNCLRFYEKYDIENVNCPNCRKAYKKKQYLYQIYKYVYIKKLIVFHT